MVKCHSNMSFSSGAAKYRSEGSMESSRISAWIRRRDGDFDMIQMCKLYQGLKVEVGPLVR